MKLQQVYSALVRNNQDNIIICTFWQIAKDAQCTKAEAIEAINLLAQGKSIEYKALESLGNGDYLLEIKIL